MSAWFNALSSVGIVSLLSFAGIIPLSLKEDKLRKVLIYFISFSAGALFGDVFIHLLPEAVEASGFTFDVAVYVISGIVVALIVEKVIHWRHCHLPITKTHVHSFAYMNLFGDAVHNFIDGLIIGASYIVDFTVGLATTIAVIFHEIPQEVGDFGVLLHGGFSKRKALFFNFITACTAFIGAIVALILNADFSFFLLPFAAGGFIYIAGSDLIPELHKECKLGSSLLQVFTFILGVSVIGLLLLIE